MAKKAAQADSAPLTITAPDFRTVAVRIEGIAPLVINKFSARSADKMKAAQEAGGASKSKRTRDAKDFEQLAFDARHRSGEDWDGIHAASFRNACISACRAAGFKMTMAKLALFIEADGFDVDDGTPLVKLTNGTAETWVATVRNQSGVVDLRPRPMYRNWSATLRVRYDAGMLSEQDVVNLLARAGLQVGVGEGRPDSKQSAGLGFGLFKLI